MYSYQLKVVNLWREGLLGTDHSLHHCRSRGSRPMLDITSDVMSREGVLNKPFTVDFCSKDELKDQEEFTQPQRSSTGTQMVLSSKEDPAL